MTHNVDTNAAAIATLALTGTLIRELIAKNLISLEDAQGIVQTAMNTVFQGNEVMRAMSRQALQSVFPNMTIHLEQKDEH